MRDQVIPDRYGNPIAFVQTTGNGSQVLYDKHYNCLGYWDAAFNVTEDHNHRRVGVGNILLMLLAESVRL